MARITPFTRPLLFAAASVLAVGATAQDTKNRAPEKKAVWSNSIMATDGGHRIGNPEAEVKLVEFMSYTCSHCAAFARTGDGAIKLLYVPTGKVSYEIRHLIRDPIDMTAALSAQCGDPGKFMGNHEALMFKHDEWMATARKATQAQTARWRFGSIGSRMQAIASDLGFYEIMEGRGYSRSQLDKCLTDEAKAREIARQSSSDVQEFGLQGTPTFIMSGQKLQAHDWKSLQPLLDKYFR